MTQPEPATVEETEQDQQDEQDTATLEAFLAAVVGAALATWLASAAAAVLAGVGAPLLTAVPLPTTLVATVVTRSRRRLLDTWRRVFDRVGAPVDEAQVTQLAERSLERLAAMLGGVDENAYTAILAAAMQAQDQQLPVSRQRGMVRDALRPGQPRWRAWAQRIARDTAQEAVESAREAAAMASGRAWEKTWTARVDDWTHVRPTHKEAHGQTVPGGSRFLVGGFQLSRPGDPSAPLSETANCRCRTRWRLVRRP